MPDHGQGRRWGLFALLTLMYVLVCFYRVSMVVVADDISRELRLSPQQLGLLSSILLYVYAAAQLPLGPMIDRLGSRLIISWCGLMAAAGGFLFSMADGLLLAMGARVLIGLGTASVLMASFTIFSRWYSQHEFGRVSSLMIACGNIGNLSATTPLALLVAAIGWRSSFLAISIAQLLITLLVFLMARDRPPGVPAHDSVPVKRQGSPFLAWQEIFGTQAFWVLGSVAFFQFGNYLALQGLWGGPYLMQVLHLTRLQSGQLLLCSSLGAVTGAMCVDYVARNLVGSYKQTLVGGQCLFMLHMTGFLGGFEFIPYPLLSVVFFSIGLVSSTGILGYPLVRAMFPARIIGTALTSINFFVLMGAAVTQQVMGCILGSYQAEGSPLPEAFHAAFLFPIVGLSISIMVYALSRENVVSQCSEPS